MSAKQKKKVKINKNPAATPTNRYTLSLGLPEGQTQRQGK